MIFSVLNSLFLSQINFNLTFNFYFDWSVLGVFWKSNRVKTKLVYILNLSQRKTFRCFMIHSKFYHYCKTILCFCTQITRETKMKNITVDLNSGNIQWKEECQATKPSIKSMKSITISPGCHKYVFLIKMTQLNLLNIFYINLIQSK